MSAADLQALYERLYAKTRRVACAWVLYGRPAIPETHQEKCWAAMAEFRAAIAESAVDDDVNDFLALTGNKPQIAEAA